MAKRHGGATLRKLGMYDFADLADVGGTTAAGALQRGLREAARWISQVSYVAWGAAEDPSLGPDVIAAIDEAQEALKKVAASVPGRLYLRDARLVAETLIERRAKAAATAATADAPLALATEDPEA